MISLKAFHLDFILPKRNFSCALAEICNIEKVVDRVEIQLELKVRAGTFIPVKLA